MGRARRKRLLFAAVTLLLVAASIELLSRAYLVRQHGASWRQPSTLIRRQYPELLSIRRTPPVADDFSLLLLGASVLHQDFGSIENELRQRLRQRAPAPPDVRNLSVPSHTTRDSWLKHELLNSHPFDVVVVYHGINDARANNCPPELYRDDYSHYQWYEKLNVYARHYETMDYCVLPYMGDYVACRVRQVLTPDRYIPRNTPRPDWIQHGAQVKTRGAFGANVRGIIATGRARGETVILVTFAYYVPDNYHRADFLAGRLDYVRHTIHPVELWGQPANIVAAVEAHNDALRQLSRENPDVLLVDMEQRIPKSGLYFRDVCHLSDAGCARFAAVLADAVIGAGGKRPQRGVAL